jgi:hypothetical protein
VCILLTTLVDTLNGTGEFARYIGPRLFLTVLRKTFLLFTRFNRSNDSIFSATDVQGVLSFFILPKLPLAVCTFSKVSLDMQLY